MSPFFQGLPCLSLSAADKQLAACLSRYCFVSDTLVDLFNQLYLSIDYAIRQVKYVVIFSYISSPGPRQMILSEDPLDLSTFGPRLIMLAATLIVPVQGAEMGCDFSGSRIIE